MATLCGNNFERWQLAKSIAREALESRLALGDAVVEVIHEILKREVNG